MIPMIPRNSSEDDRPSGLKFNGGNNYSFPRREESTRTAPVNILSRTNQYDEQQQQGPSSSGGNNSNYNQIRISSSSNYSRVSSAPYSPTLPTRSPHRIRDSQQTAVTGSNSNNKPSTSHASKSNSSLDESPPSAIYSSVSTCSDSSDDDDDLTQEVENLWKLKTRDSDNNSSNSPVQQQLDKQQKKSEIDSDEMLLQLLISQATVDAREYQVLTYEDVEKLKKRHEKLKDQISSSAAKLDLNKTIQGTSHSLSNLSTNKNRESVMILLNEVAEVDEKVKMLAQRLHELKSEQVDAELKLLQHTAGVLSQGLQKLEMANTTTATTTVKHQASHTNVSSIISRNSSKSSSISSSSSHANETQKKISNLSLELETIKNTLYNIVKKHDKSPIPIQSSNNTKLLFDRLESQLESFKSQQKDLELNSTLRSNADINAISRIEELENNLDSNQKIQNHMQQELQQEHAHVAKLKETLSNIEIQSNKVQSQVTALQDREDNLKKEIEQYQDQVFKLRQENEQWERTMKQKTTMQVMEGSIEQNEASVNAKFEQKLMEQEKEYQAQFQEQVALLEETREQKNELQEKQDMLTATCRDLDKLLRDKQKTLDDREAEVSRLESELVQQKMMAAEAASAADMKTSLPATTAIASNNNHNDVASHESLDYLQAQFTEKEEAWIEQSTNMEANFEGILKVVNRLAAKTMEFETDKQNYETHINTLTEEIKKLENNLTEERTKNLGYETDTPTTASLRKEFRAMINDMKSEHQRALEREVEEKRKLERQLKDLKQEKEMAVYERTNRGVQTLYIV